MCALKSLHIYPASPCSACRLFGGAWSHDVAVVSPRKFQTIYLTFTSSREAKTNDTCFVHFIKAHARSAKVQVAPLESNTLGQLPTLPRSRRRVHTRRCSPSTFRLLDDQLGPTPPPPSSDCRLCPKRCNCSHLELLCETCTHAVKQLFFFPFPPPISSEADETSTLGCNRLYLFQLAGPL